MQLYKKGLAAVAVVSGAVTFSAGSAYAIHDHFVVTPNGNCHQVARGRPQSTTLPQVGTTGTTTMCTSVQRAVPGVHRSNSVTDTLLSRSTRVSAPPLPR